MFKKIIIAIIFIALIVTGVIFAIKLQNRKLVSSGVQETQTEKIKITATFFPLADFARQIGGNLVDVTTLTPSGAEPHDFEPTPQDIIKINSSKVFIFNGGEIDMWAANVAKESEKFGVITVEANRAIQESEKIKNQDETNPHFWVNPVFAGRYARAITNAIISADPANKDIYIKNSVSFLAQLNNLDATIKTELSSCKKNYAIVAHDAFEYFARQYKINLIPIAGLSPEAEPSAKKIAELVDLAKQKEIKYIFFEDFTSPKISETIAREVGAQTLVLSPVENISKEDAAVGQGYIDAMQENLRNLKKALVCE